MYLSGFGAILIPVPPREWASGEDVKTVAPLRILSVIGKRYLIGLSDPEHSSSFHKLLLMK